MRPHINPARQESTGQGGHCSGLPLLSWADQTGHFYAHAAAHPFPSIPCGCGFCGNGSPVLHRALTERRTLLYSTIPLCWSADFLTVPASMENSTRRIQGPALLAALNA